MKEMTQMTPRLRSMLRHAERAAKANKRLAAEQLYRELLDEAPDMAEAWAGLAGVQSSTAEQEASYKQALKLDPQNERAITGLAVLRGEAPPADPEADEEIADDSDLPSGLPTFDYRKKSSPRSWEEAPTVAARFSETPDEAGSTDDTQAAQNGAAQPLATPEQAMSDDELTRMVCYRHSERETNLRCYSCGRPICSSCAQPTPVGYRCPTCMKESEDVFFTATSLDYAVAVAVAVPLSIAGALLASLIGFWLLWIFLGPTLGTLFGRIIRAVIGRRRGRYIPLLVVSIVVLGSLAFMLLTGGFISQGIYLFMAGSSLYYALK